MIFPIRRVWGAYETDTIELNTLDDLLALVNKEGEIIVSKTEKGQHTLEIYDDYRE